MRPSGIGPGLIGPGVQFRTQGLVPGPLFQKGRPEGAAPAGLGKPLWRPERDEVRIELTSRIGGGPATSREAAGISERLSA